MGILSILGLLTLCCPALCVYNEVRIHNEEDFTNFVNDVNSGSTKSDYVGTTVFLENNLDFTDYGREFNPIGFNSPTPFSGTFDGQGFGIDGIRLNVTDGYAGLFGYARGATVKNIVFSIKTSASVCIHHIR